MAQSGSRFTIAHYGDDRFQGHLEKHYTKVREATYKLSEYGFGRVIAQYELYAISSFLETKLSPYPDVKSTISTRIWIFDNKVAKLYHNKEIFSKVIDIQTSLYNADIGCRLIETWTNPEFPEYFTVSEYKGQSIAQKYGKRIYHHPKSRDPAIPEAIYDKIDDILKKLKSLGYEQEDPNEGNFVEDENGTIRMIDYDSVYRIGELY
jgi:hypothetical protein